MTINISWLDVIKDAISGNLLGTHFAANPELTDPTAVIESASLTNVEFEDGSVGMLNTVAERPSEAMAKNGVLIFRGVDGRVHAELALDTETGVLAGFVTGKAKDVKRLGFKVTTFNPNIR